MRTRVDRTGRFLTWFGVASLALSAATSAQEPPKPAAPASLARYFPRKDLVVYVEFDGLDAHRDTWTQSAAYRLLTETTTGAMLEQSAAQVLDLVLSAQSQIPAKGPDLIAMGKQLLRSGFALGINRSGGVGSPRCLALVIRGAATGAPRAAFDRFRKAVEGAGQPVKTVEKPGGRKVKVVGESGPGAMAWWSEGDDLVVSLVSPSGVDAIIAALEGREPNAVDHPNRLALTKSADAPGFVPVGMAFFDMAALPPLPPQAVALGLDRIKRFDYRWGFHGPAIQSILGAVVPAPRKGIPALFDQPSFDAQHLPPLPGGLSGFTVFSLEASRLYEQILAAIRAVDPAAAQAVDALEPTFQQVIGLKLHDEFLAPVGSRVVLYTFPTRMNAPNNMLAGFGRALVFVPKSVGMIEVKDREAMARALETLAAHSGREARLAGSPGKEISVTVKAPPMQRLKGSDLAYVFPPSESTSTLSIPVGGRLTLLLGKKDLIFGASPATARRARDLSEQGKPGLPPNDALAGALQQLPDRLTFLAVSDLRESMLPDVLVTLPNLIDLIASDGKGLLTLGEGLMTFFVDPGNLIGSLLSGPKSAHQSKAAIDPDLIPEPDTLRPFLFPSVSVLSVDDQGIRFLSRQAFPTIHPAIVVVPAVIALFVL